MSELFESNSLSSLNNRVKSTLLLSTYLLAIFLKYNSKVEIKDITGNFFNDFLITSRIKEKTMLAKK
jgi:hypothetical protein